MKYVTIAKVPFPVYCDLDGVLCDFESAALRIFPEFSDDMDKDTTKRFWNKIKEQGSSFWSNLQWLPGSKEMWKRILPYSPRILTSCPSSGTKKAQQGKLAWVKKNLGDVKVNFVIGDKSKFAIPNSVLIDDSEKHIKAWNKKGGEGILFTDPKKINL